MSSWTFIPSLEFKPVLTTPTSCHSNSRASTHEHMKPFHAMRYKRGCEAPLPSEFLEGKKVKAHSCPLFVSLSHRWGEFPTLLNGSHQCQLLITLSVSPSRPLQPLQEGVSQQPQVPFAEALHRAGLNKTKSFEEWRRTSCSNKVPCFYDIVDVD